MESHRAHGCIVDSATCLALEQGVVWLCYRFYFYMNIEACGTEVASVVLKSSPMFWAVLHLILSLFGYGAGSMMLRELVNRPVEFDTEFLT